MKQIKLDVAERPRHQRKVRVAVTLILCIFLTMPVSASTGGDPLETINKLSEFIFAGIRAVGIIMLGLGIVQIGLAVKGHDPAQRSQGIMVCFGGVLIVFAKQILDMIL